VEAGLVGTSSCCISTSSLQSKLSYGPSDGTDRTLRPGGRAGGAAAPQVEGVRLPTELDTVEDDSVKLEEMVDGARGPRKRSDAIITCLSWKNL
jgi:hypothetical protein